MKNYSVSNVPSGLPIWNVAASQWRSLYYLLYSRGDARHSVRMSRKLHFIFSNESTDQSFSLDGTQTTGPTWTRITSLTLAYMSSGVSPWTIAETEQHILHLTTSPSTSQYIWCDYITIIITNYISHDCKFLMISTSLCINLSLVLSVSV